MWGGGGRGRQSFTGTELKAVSWVFIEKMVPCSAKGCKATMGTPGIIFFRFPKDYLERGWMQMVN